MDPVLQAFLVSWGWRADVILVLALLAAAYILGWWHLRTAGHSALARGGRLVCYLAGLATVYVALLSPIDSFASLLFTMHMVQHELLTIVAVPLLLLANPLPIVLWALPRWLRRGVGGLLTRDAAVRRGLWALTLMPVTWVLYQVTFWAWHLPTAYEAAVRNGLLHDLQHLSIFGAALLFWWPIINPAPRLHGHIPYAYRVIYVFPAMILPMLLVMSIAFFAKEVFYSYYTAVPRLWGLTGLEDQTVGWVLMGVWEGFTYMGLLLVLIAKTLDDEERVTRQRESLGLVPGKNSP